MKRLLHIGCNVGTESMPKYFREVCDYSELRLDSQLVINLEKIVQIPDIIFIQIQSDQIDGKNTVQFLGEAINSLKKRGSYIINWTGDKRNGVPRWMIDFHKYVSITGFSNQEDVDAFNSIHKDGAIFLQQGIDTDIFKPEGDKKETSEIVFLANNYGNQFPLSGYRKDIINALRSKYGTRFKVYGNGWPGDSGNVNHSQYEEAKIYRSCKIAISCSHYDADRYFSDRLGRALCSGAFVLSHHYKGLEKDWSLGDDFEHFDNIPHLIQKIDYWLNNDELRNFVSEKGCKKASEKLSYRTIVNEIINLNK